MSERLLNWLMMLIKQETFIKCFDNFIFLLIAAYDEEKIGQIINAENMIRSPRKINAIIRNAKCFQKIIDEYGSFDAYIWSFLENKIIIYSKHHQGFP